MSVFLHCRPYGALLLGFAGAIIPVLWSGLRVDTMHAWEGGIVLALIACGVLLPIVFMDSRPKLGLVVVPATVFIASCLCIQVFLLIREAKVAALRERLTDYTDLSVQPEAGTPPPDPLIQGKVVVVDMTKRDIDHFHHLLPNAFRARTPAEVGVVLQLTWGEVAVGRYTNGGTAMRRYCDARFIAISPQVRLLHEAQFYGERPPDKTRSSGNTYGSYPHAQLTDFLKARSRRSEPVEPRPTPAEIADILKLGREVKRAREAAEDSPAEDTAIEDPRQRQAD